MGSSTRVCFTVCLLLVAAQALAGYDFRPDNPVTRYKLAAELIACQRFDEAVEHARWCLRRRPNDPAYKNLLTRARRGQLEHEAPVWQAERSDNGPFHGPR